MKNKQSRAKLADDVVKEIQLTDIYNLDEIQHLQNLFSDAMGVASIITHPDGTPITKPSNFCRLCSDIIRKTKKGRLNCYQSDAALGQHHSSGPVVQPCLSGELWDAGASITAGGKHIANWLIGQVRNEESDEQRMIAYADEIGANKEDFMKALAEVPVMSLDQFNKVSKMLFAFSNQLSEKAHTNLLLKMQIAENEKATKLLKETEERFRSLFDNAPLGRIAKDITELKHTEEALRKSEQMLHTVLDHFPGIVFWKDNQSIYSGCNQAFAEGAGLQNPAEIIGKTDFELPWGNTEAESYRVDDYEVMHSGKKKLNIIETQHQIDGQVLWVDTSKIPIRDSDGKVIGLIGVSNNITEKKLAEEALKESDVKYRELVENFPDAITIYAEGKIVLVNKECLRLMAASTPEELIGKPVEQFVHPGSLSLVAERMKKAAKEGSVLPFAEEKFVRLDGSVVAVEVKAVPIRLRNRHAVQLIVRDITERKQAEETISMLAHAIRSISESVSITDMTDKIIFVNSAFLKTYQYEENEIIGNSINMVRSPKNPLELVRKILPATQHGGWHGELLNRRKDGTEFPVFVSSSVVHDEYGEPLALIGVTTDITERKKAENEILELNEKLEQRVKQRTAELETVIRELETFSYSISHDLKTPLRHINGFIDLFLDHKSTELTIEELGYLKNISDSASDMAHLIDAILSFSRLNQAELQKTVIHSSKMVQHVIKFLEPDSKNRKITFNVEPLPVIKGDGKLIQQVWTNLISNAIKYTGKKAEAIIDIGSIATDTGTSFFIRDNGIGFNMKHAQKLFGVFQRLHKSADFEGVGIGLANVNRIVSRHGGKCHAESQPDHGATFYFTIPD
ncbi:MAG: PAS domain S-box protein [Bacteroidetes bacterium]|nr:PAS domain S-box protein [Bacteroidota bacterium]